MRFYCENEVIVFISWKPERFKILLMFFINYFVSFSKLLQCCIKYFIIFENLEIVLLLTQRSIYFARCTIRLIVSIYYVILNILFPYISLRFFCVKILVYLFMLAEWTIFEFYYDNRILNFAKYFKWELYHTIVY